MDASKLPIAADHPEDNNIGVVTFSRQLASPSHHGRPRIAVEPLGCLSLLDQGEQNGRPYALPSPDVRNKNWIASTKQKSQPIVHVQRPRAVLSSPENDDLSRELQHEAEESENIVIAPPKAPLSLLEEPSSTGVGANFVAENSISSTDVNQENSDVSLSPKDSLTPSNSRNSLDPSNSRITKHKVTKGKSIGQCTMSETKAVSSRGGNDENFLTPVVRNQLGKKNACMPSAPSSIGLKMHTNKAMAKGDSGRVVRPWY